jgi:hypothetical protein
MENCVCVCVCVEVLTNVTADRVICVTVKKVRRGSIEYIDKRKDYHSLMFMDTDILHSS